MSVSVRPATADDEQDLRRLDRATWTPEVSPAPAPTDGAFFSDRHVPADHLVAERDGRVVGYVRLGRTTELVSNAHVIAIHGLAVDPVVRRAGVGRALVAAALEEARRRGARKVSLRVLGPNTAARELYRRCGFGVEGVLRGEFHLDGRDVDDVLMARHLDTERPAGRLTGR